MGLLNRPLYKRTFLFGSGVKAVRYGIMVVVKRGCEGTDFVDGSFVTLNSLAAVRVGTA